MSAFPSFTKNLYSDRKLFILIGFFLLAQAFYQAYIHDSKVSEQILAFTVGGMGYFSAAYKFRRMSFVLSASTFICFLTFAFNILLNSFATTHWHLGLWATCLLSQAYLLIKLTTYMSRWSNWISTVLGSGILTIGIVSLTGWFANITSEYSWMLSENMGALMAFITIAIGVIIILMTGRIVYRQAYDFPIWMFVTNFLIVFTSAICMCIAILSQENEFIRSVTRDFSLSISKGDQVIYEKGDQNDYYRDSMGSKQHFSLLNDEWTVEVWPDNELVAEHQSIIAPSVLIIGTITSFLVGTTVFLFFTARKHANSVIRSNKAISTFLLNITHEVRTPLNGIIGTASLIANTELNPKQKRFVQIIEKSGKLLLKLINDILDISTIETGEIKLNMQEVDLHQIVTDSVRLFTTKASEKNIELILDFPKIDVEKVLLDSARFKQVLTNLIGNAMKFTEKGYVYIGVRLEPLSREMSMLSIFVKDTGIGIDKLEQERVFDKFSQVDQSYTKVHQGSGLGLSISKHLMEIMEGSLNVSSTYGEGSSFEMSLPVKCLSCRVDGDSTKLLGSSILIVSSDPKSKEVLMKYTEGWGMVGCSASSLFDVIDTLVETQEGGPPLYDYILMDGDTMEVDCLEVEKLLIVKRVHEYSNFMLLTNMESVNMVDGLAMSYMHVIPKPLTAYELKDMLVKVALKQTARELV